MKTLETVEESEEAIKIKLLQLIEDGDATVILSSEYIESLNELIKFEFVSIDNERLQLTEKGQQAKLFGLNKFMDNNFTPREEIKISDFPEQKVTRGISNQAFLIILFFFFISLIAIITLLNT